MAKIYLKVKRSFSCYECYFFPKKEGKCKNMNQGKHNCIGDGIIYVKTAPTEYTIKDLKCCANCKHSASFLYHTLTCGLHNVETKSRNICKKWKYYNA